MRKQVDFDVRSLPLGNGSGGESFTREQMCQIVKTEYLDKGWELFSNSTNQVYGGAISILYIFLKYEDVPDSVGTAKVVGGSK